MTSTDQARKAFLLGSLFLVVLIVGGLIWAVSAPGESGGTGGAGFRDDNDPSFGPGEATLVVRVFGDFQCPACKAAEAGFRYAKNTYGDKVRFVWNDFPLQSIHQNAFAAANAARCAEAQGKFWEYHDRLYDDQSGWSELPSPQQAFVGYAEALGLDKGAFESCVAERKYQSKINDDLTEGSQNGVNATPTFFIGDAKFPGVLDQTAWDREIQARLTAQK
ncbi:thioredoxin domain-containing protein [Candidatus Uhrbacteria bacterium]|nr:thioredoxin domain-containing protein [Candidatus Uhrbacteria bacterium]